MKILVGYNGVTSYTRLDDVIITFLVAYVGMVN